MKTIAASEAQQSLDSVLTSAQKERIVLTRRGKPSAVVIGIESYDDEDLYYATSGQFWEMIESRRKEGASASSEEVRSRLGLGGRVKVRRKKGKTTKRSKPAAKR